MCLLHPPCRPGLPGCPGMDGKLGMGHGTGNESGAGAWNRASLPHGASHPVRPAAPSRSRPPPPTCVVITIVTGPSLHRSPGASGTACAVSFLCAHTHHRGRSVGTSGLGHPLNLNTHTTKLGNEDVTTNKTLCNYLCIILGRSHAIRVSVLDICALWSRMAQRGNYRAAAT